MNDYLDSPEFASYENISYVVICDIPDTGEERSNHDLNADTDMDLKYVYGIWQSMYLVHTVHTQQAHTLFLFFYSLLGATFFQAQKMDLDVKYVCPICTAS